MRQTLQPYLRMNDKKLFEIVFSEEALVFLKSLDSKHYNKIMYNIRKSQVEVDAELFKKLTEDIWEFRTLYAGLQYRLLAFWDNTGENQTLVVATHGFIKKRSKVPDNEIQRARQIQINYFKSKNK